MGAWSSSYNALERWQAGAGRSTIDKPVKKVYISPMTAALPALPAGFDPAFALHVMLPLVQDAYDTETVALTDLRLPAGFQATALIEADVSVLQKLTAPLATGAEVSLEKVE